MEDDHDIYEENGVKETFQQSNNGYHEEAPAVGVASTSLLPADKILLRLIELEERCVEQDHEIGMLRSCMSDIMKRMTELENQIHMDKENQIGSQFKTTDPSSPSKSKTRLQASSSLNGTSSEGQLAGSGSKKCAAPKKASRPNSSPAECAPLGSTHGLRSVSRGSSLDNPVRLSQRSSSENASNPMDLSAGSEKPKLILAKRQLSQRKRIPSNSDEQTLQSKDGLVKFFIRGRSLSLYAPSYFDDAKTSGSPPDKKLALEWVYGYRGRDCRANLALLTSGDLVYNMAGVVVLYSQKTGKQRHYQEHSADVKCVAIHPTQSRVASGQSCGHGGKAHVRVWNPSTLQTESEFGFGYFERGVSALAFSCGEGDLLAVVDESNEHTLFVWDWKKREKITETKGSQEVIFSACWNPIASSMFVTCGKSHLAFWMYNTNTKLLSKKAAIFEKHGKAKYVLCTAFLKTGELLSGDSSGSLCLFKKGSNRVLKSIENAHEGGVCDICTIEDDRVVTGGKNGLLSLWSRDLVKLQDLAKIDEQFGSPRCIIQDTIENSFLVGTTKNCILEVQGDYATCSLLMQGHHDEMWGLAVHPSLDLFLTCAYDQHLCVWDGEYKRMKWSRRIEAAAQCGAFHPTETVLLIGTVTGKILVINSESGDDVTELRIEKDAMDIKISPDGKAMAVGCRDSNIYLFQWPSSDLEFKKPRVMQGHSSFVSHLDWSVDSQFLQSNSGDYELLYWQAEAALQVVTPAALRDVKWATWTCPFGFPVMGIWPEGADGTDINACDRSPDGHYVATGDDFGAVKLFTYPCTKLRSDGYTAAGHSSHVTCVRFLPGGRSLVSVGGKDCSVMQWKIIPSE